MKRISSCVRGFMHGSLHDRFLVLEIWTKKNQISYFPRPQSSETKTVELAPQHIPFKTRPLFSFYYLPYFENRFIYVPLMLLPYVFCLFRYSERPVLYAPVSVQTLIANFLYRCTGDTGQRTADRKLRTAFILCKQKLCYAVLGMMKSDGLLR